MGKFTPVVTFVLRATLDDIEAEDPWEARKKAEEIWDSLRADADEYLEPVAESVSVDPAPAEPLPKWRKSDAIGYW